MPHNWLLVNQICAATLFNVILDGFQYKFTRVKEFLICLYAIVHEPVNKWYGIKLVK